MSNLKASVFRGLFVDIKLGYALLRDRRVPSRTKFMALSMGVAALGIIEMLEIPLEGVLAAILPVVGIAGDLLVDGAEALIVPVLIACIFLPFLTPRAIVRQIRAELAA